MGFPDIVSVLIFSLVLMSVAVFLTMSRWIIGPLTQLKPVERIMLSAMLVGVFVVLIYATTELLFHVVF